MNVGECVSRYGANVRRMGLRMSCAQVLVALARGKCRRRDIVADSGLKGNTARISVTVLRGQGIVWCAGTVKPRVYFLTQEGVRVARELMIMTREDGDDE